MGCNVGKRRRQATGVTQVQKRSLNTVTKLASELVKDRDDSKMHASGEIKENSKASRPTFQPSYTPLGDVMQEKRKEEKEVQHSHLAIHNSSDLQTTGQRPSAPISEKTYNGRITFFRGTYGWVDCAEVQQRHNGRQVHLHKSDCVGNFNPRQCVRDWTLIVFQLAYDPQGNPKAVNAQICSSSLDQTEDSKTIKVEDRITLSEYKNSKAKMQR